MNQFEPPIKIEKKKHPSEMLRDMFRSLSEEVNARAKGENIADDLLSTDGSLDPLGYKDLFAEAELEADAQYVRGLELEFSKFYRGEPGVENEDDMIRKWREGKNRQKSGQMEMAVTVLLSQMLGEDFLVVRTAPYDDYKNGVDNLIVNRATGEVVGAFDEVHDDESRIQEKKEKIIKIAEKGGANIRYGLGFKRNKLKRAKIENVPVFYLGLAESELLELVQALGDDHVAIKQKIFKKLLGSLADQQKELLTKAVSIPLRVKLKSFGESIARLETLAA